MPKTKKTTKPTRQETLLRSYVKELQASIRYMESQNSNLQKVTRDLFAQNRGLRERLNTAEANRPKQSTWEEVSEDAEVVTYKDTNQLFNGPADPTRVVGEVRNWRNGWIAIYLDQLPIDGRLVVRPRSRG